MIKTLKFKPELGFFTTVQRSEQMKKIRNKGTKPELLFRKSLWGKGYRYRVNVKKLAGSPDIVLSRYKVAIFIDGEFWHGYDWKQKREKIKSNRKFWIPKIERNMERDQENNNKLKDAGYMVFRFWESEIKKDLDTCVQKVIEYISTLK